MQRFNEYKMLDLWQVNKDILEKWKTQNTFEESLKTRSQNPSFVFYEGPPSANGKPGIHHVLSRTVKDVFCRYKTLKGFYVERKAGWDTHGLPVELQVEKALGITKDDIGVKISIEEYNQRCRKDVMQFIDVWNDLTEKMGFWLDMKNPYITYNNKYIETLWYLLSELFKKGLLYKGYTIQPYSPAAGTGLSTHELNLQGCYKEVTDTTVIAMFKVIRNAQSEKIFTDVDTDVYMLAWTTTPWTLLSNTALTVGADIIYQKIKTFNPYTGTPITVILAKDRVNAYFSEKDSNIPLEAYKKGDKVMPYKVIAEYKGIELSGIRYEQLLPYKQPTDGDAFKIVTGDFVTTSDGTGIVHTAPSFGADDFRMSKQHGLGTLTLVDKQGKFVDGVGEFSGRFVKNAYDPKLTESDNSVDVDIAVKLKKEGKAFKIEKYTHSYPHCWRTDKPILYYPLDSWFIKTTALKQRLIELNNTINWKPESTGTGRFGQWLENLVDWNLSRSRYWGTPLPIWISEDKKEIKCIGSVAMLKHEIQKSVEVGFMQTNPLSQFNETDFSQENYNIFDLHRPYIDKIVLVSETGKKMFREPDLIDVWFDSGAMPYAEQHYPFENVEIFKRRFPADFIAEGVDQTRGWFFTLHAIATLVFDSVAFKNVISHGLVLDKDGQKMSKRIGNVIDPFNAIEQHGADAVRWYMMTNSQPWDNLKFDAEGINEVKRKFFGTLFNTYSFFALYANIDGFSYKEPDVPYSQLQEIDRWIISLLNTLIKDVESYYEDYEPTKAGRAIQHFVIEHLSNWYVRLNRKRYWGGEYNTDKIAAYQVLYKCLETVAILASPLAPFYSDKLFSDLNQITKKQNVSSVHLAFFPKYNEELVDKSLEERMDIAQRISSMVLGLRRKVNIKVRQPLQKILIPIISEQQKNNIQAVSNLIISEVNVKSIEFLTDTSGIIIKKVKPNFKILGPKVGKSMKEIADIISKMNQQEIIEFEKTSIKNINVNGQIIPITLQDVEIISEDIPGWQTANDNDITVALDITITETLKEEGIARELINRIQHLRKESGFEVTDKIIIYIEKNSILNAAVEHFKEYISSQTLANDIILSDNLKPDEAKCVEFDENISFLIKIIKLVNNK